MCKSNSQILKPLNLAIKYTCCLAVTWKNNLKEIPLLKIDYFTTKQNFLRLNMCFKNCIFYNILLGFCTVFFSLSPPHPLPFTVLRIKAVAMHLLANALPLRPSLTSFILLETRKHWWKFLYTKKLLKHLQYLQRQSQEPFLLLNPSSELFYIEEHM